MLKSEKSETPDKAKHLSLHKCNKATKASGTLKFSDIFVGINLKKRRNLELVLYDLFMFKGKSPEVPFHGITSPYNYFEVIWIFAPIQQEAKHDQEKLSAEQK